MCVILIALGTIFQSFDIIDYWFQSKILSKYVVYARNTAFLITLVLKVIFVIIRLPVTFFAMAILIELIISAIGMIMVYQVQHKSILNWKLDLNWVGILLKNSWFLLLSNATTIIYMQIGQVMIKEMKGNNAAGIFGIVSQITGFWYYIPMSVCSSVFPAVIEAKKVNENIYRQRVQNILDLMILMTIPVALLITFFFDYPVKIFLGTEYLQVIPVMKVYFWSSVFVALGLVSGQWLIAENLQQISFYRSVMGCIASIVFNFLLIPNFGVMGAALAMLASQMVAGFLFDFTNKKTLPMAIMKIKSLFLIDGIKTLKSIRS